MNRISSATVLLAATAALAGCTSTSVETRDEGFGVRIDTISPDTATIGDEITIRGSGFEAANDVGFTADGTTAFAGDVVTVDSETLTLVLDDMLGECPDTQLAPESACPDIGYEMPLGEVTVNVFNRNGNSNGVVFIRAPSPIEVAREAVSGDPVMEALTEQYKNSIGYGFRQDADGTVYLEFNFLGFGPGEIELPDQIAGYEVRQE